MANWKSSNEDITKVVIQQKSNKNKKKKVVLLSWKTRVLGRILLVWDFTIFCIFVLFFAIEGSTSSGEPSISDVKGKNKYPKSDLSSSRSKR